MPFHIIEPHPSASSGYLHAGRGGAGNYARYNKKDLTTGSSASGPASAAKVLPPPPTSSQFTSGRGGAGNTFKRSESQRAIFSFDEELAREQKMRDNAAKAPVYHIGRGGAGNAVDEMKPVAAQRMGSTSSASSMASDGSDKRRSGVVNAFGRLSRTLTRN